LRKLKHSSLSFRLSARAFQIALLAVLAAGTALIPFRLAAQESAPAQSATGEQAKPAESPEEAQSNAFRHTGLVLSAAKALNLPVEVVARSFEFINFAIIALVVGIPLVKIVPKSLRARASKVAGDIESARKMTEDANARLSAVEAKLASLHDEIAKFRSEVEQESVQDEARIKASLEDESARIVSAAEQEIGVAAAQARRGLRTFAAELAIEQAAKQLVFTPEADKALISEFVRDLVGTGAAKGGQN